MIVGITHQRDGRTIRRFPALIKLSIGLPSKDGQGPSKVDYILFKRYDPATGDWVVDENLQGKFGKTRSVDIVLIHDTPDENFRTSYEMWSAQQCLCRGDGLRAQRFFSKLEQKNGRVLYTPLNEPIEVPCDAERRCPYLESERCRPRGVLYFLLVDHLLFGTVCKLSTSSFASVRNIYSTLSEIYQARGTLRWLPLRLSVEAVTAYPKARGRKKTVNFVWTVTYEGLARHGNRIRQFLEGLSARPEIVAELKSAQEASDALERPSEIQAEFYPKNADLQAEPPKEAEEEWALF